MSDFAKWIPRNLRSTELSLGNKQKLHTLLGAHLVLHIVEETDLAVVVFEAQRSEQAARWNATHCSRCKRAKGDAVHREGHRFRPIGIVNSLHRVRLAWDIGLFRGPKYLTSSSDYAAVGKVWKSWHPLARWGGDFRRPDGGHFSITHRGRA